MNSNIPSAVAVLRQHGRSFYWASWFLGRKKAAQAARLYAFCRAVDDLADLNPDTAYVLDTLTRWQAHIQQGHSDDETVEDVLLLAREVGFDRAALIYLMQGLRSDLTRTQITDEAELIRYAFYVAGTVGLMMSDLLGATDPAAKKFALDLGIAMQLTNILRDVAEDASAGRQYLPQSWLGPGINFFQPNDETGTLARPQFARLHALAQRYYASGYAGMRYLPARSRLAIMIAARLYQEIGLQAARRNFPVLQQRMIISPQRKCWLVGGCLLRFLKESIMPQPLPAHDTDLHSSLKPLLNPL